MKPRPRSILGLTVHALKLRWAGLDRSRKLVVLGVAIALGLSLAVWGRCMLGSGTCPSSGGCPYAALPCAR